jgi:hypothetical protein
MKQGTKRIRQLSNTLNLQEFENITYKFNLISEKELGKEVRSEQVKFVLYFTRKGIDGTQLNMIGDSPLSEVAGLTRADRELHETLDEF